MSTGMISNTNLFSLSSLVAAGRNTSDLSSSINKLSSGLRINTFMDDPSRMSISEKMRGFILGLQTSSQNAQDGISYLQTAEGNGQKWLMIDLEDRDNRYLDVMQLIDIRRGNHL